MEAATRDRVSVPGRAGGEIADLIASAIALGREVLPAIVRTGLERLLSRTGGELGVLQAGELFDDKERLELVDALAAAIGTAKLLGRAQVRQRLADALRRRGIDPAKAGAAEGMDWFLEVTDAEGHQHDASGKFTGSGGGESKPKPQPKKRLTDRGHEIALDHRDAVFTVLAKLQSGALDPEQAKARVMLHAETAADHSRKNFVHRYHAFEQRMGEQFGHEALLSDEWGAVRKEFGDGMRQMGEHYQAIAADTRKAIDYFNKTGAFPPGTKNGLSQDTDALADAHREFATRMADAFDVFAAKHKKLHEAVLEVPAWRQETPYTCGAAALASALVYFGIDGFDEDGLAADLGTNSADGTPPESILRVARDRGLEADGRDGLTLGDLAAALDAGLPVLCPIQAYGTDAEARQLKAGHWVVVIGYDEDFVYLQDPASDAGIVRLSPGDFDRAWCDQEADGTVYDHYGILLSRPVVEGLQLREDLGPMEPARAVDYFTGLVPTLGTDTQRFGDDLRRHAFTLAVATEKELLSSVQDVVRQRLQTGQGIKSAPHEIDALLDAAGVAPGNPQYAEAVFRTNTHDAYHQGGTEALQDPDVIGTFPVWQYSNPDDVRSRPEHADRAGNYYPSTVPFVKVRGTEAKDSINCRCDQIPIDRWTWAKRRAAGAKIAGGYPDVLPEQPRPVMQPMLPAAVATTTPETTAAPAASTNLSPVAAALQDAEGLSNFDAARIARMGPFAQREAIEKLRGNRTLYRDVVRGWKGINPASVSDFGREWLEEQGLPKKLFNKKGGNLDEIAGHYGISENEVLDRLRDHYVIDSAARIDKELEKQEREYYDMQQALAAANPRSSADEIAAHLASLAREAEETGRSASRAGSIEEALGEGHRPEDVGADPGDFNPAEFEQPPQPQRTRTTWIDEPDTDPFYRPQKLPGMGDVAADVQAQLWADVPIDVRPKPTPSAERPRSDHPALFPSSTPASTAAPQLATAGLSLSSPARALVDTIRKKATDKFRVMENRYGRKGALAVLGSIVALAPIPIPGLSFVPIGVAEAFLKMKSFLAEAAEQPAGEDLDALIAVVRKLIGELCAEAGEPVPAFSDEAIRAAIEGELAQIAH